MKKTVMAMAAGAIILVLASCGQTKGMEGDKSDIMGSVTGIGDEVGEGQETQNDDNKTPAENPEDETVNEKESSATQQENSAQAAGNADSEMTADELLDLFINGSISAVDSTDSTSAFYITDFNMDSEEWDSYSVGEKADIDNDGENELIICGPYGGIYLDARDNKVYEFAAGEGTAVTLSYTYYNGAAWIMYSSRSSAGFEFYHMEKFEGADNLVAEMNLGEELADPDNAEAGMKYTWNETVISYDEYTELCSKILAAEVNTTVNQANNDSQIEKDGAPEDLAGEYEYLSDGGTGRLIINKTSCGYDISDYESDSSYRFLADTSNIETIENNRIHIKYPEQVFSDDTVIFGYYILECGTDEIDVYYGKSFEEAQFLYHAVRK